MKWEYKNHTIEVNGNGIFTFNTADGSYHSCDTLREAKKLIDKLMAEYYNMTQEQYKQLLDKLTDREKDFVNSMVDELHGHEYSAYCELGLSGFNFTLPENE
jgi:hypothetical protein